MKTACDLNKTFSNAFFIMKNLAFSTKFVSEGIIYKPALVKLKVMVWHQMGNKPFP